MWHVLFFCEISPALFSEVSGLKFTKFLEDIGQLSAVLFWSSDILLQLKLMVILMQWLLEIAFKFWTF